jgi:hypothetical protein
MSYLVAVIVTHTTLNNFYVPKCTEKGLSNSFMDEETES